MFKIQYLTDALLPVFGKYKKKTGKSKRSKSNCRLSTVDYVAKSTIAYPMTV